MRLERLFSVEPAFDRRHKDPDKNYGIHGAQMRFVVKGELGAAQFLLYTNWHLPHVQKELTEKCNPVTPYGRFCHLEPLPADIGYHSPKPMYEGQESIQKSCEYLNGAPCYYDGSSLNAVKYFEILVSKGHEALWKALEEYYKSTFDKLIKEAADGKR